ncbi:MAG: phosphoribosylanthranilate isomerase [Rhodocyclaceae bacterium]|nr:phosphoribosylanthranilate isomerase [Rhodocyclaceae bacterium]MCA3084502.1 phosphoribosylanthranilate isomerase [Rhodocyclaceae bacterium]
MPMPNVKLCCIASIAEAELAISSAATALGLVSAMPSGPGVIDERQIATIAAHVATTAPSIRTFLLTAKTEATDIIAQHQRCRTTTLQLVDHVPHAVLRELRRALPTVELVQVIHVIGEASLNEAINAAPLVDVILLDSGNQSLAVKELGGTGRTHDWSVSRQIRDAVDKPVFLAGGLNAANLRDAVAAVQPYGLDVCSGLRTNGLLDARKVNDFMRELQ